MTIQKCHGCRSLVYCTKNNIGFGSVVCQSKMNFTPKKQPEPKPKHEQKQEEPSTIRVLAGATVDFLKKGVKLFDG